MTNREVYIIGWVYGYLSSKMQGNFDTSLACMRPYRALAEIVLTANRNKILNEETDKKVASALNEIDSIEPPMDGGVEKVIPLEQQGSWQLGYYCGKSGRPLPPSKEKINIELKRREKGLSQTELAEMIGATQPMVSKWEKGLVTPSDEYMEKLKKILI